MPVNAIPGNIHFRAYQLGKETSFGTPVPATVRLPWRFVPTVDPHWTPPDVDTGTLDPALPPYRTATDVTGTSTGPLDYNSAPYLWAALIKGGVTPSGGTDKTWAFAASSTTQDPFEIFTGEHFDDVAGNDYRYGSGVLESLQLTYPQDLGPIQTSASWRFATVDYPQAHTTGLSVDPAPFWTYGADTSLYIDTTAGGIGGTQIVDTMHDATVTITNNLDVKRYANGSNTRFEVAGYGRGGLRALETVFTFAETTQGLVEAAKYLATNPARIYVSLKTQGVDAIVPGTYYSHDLRFAGYWFTNAESAVNQNAALTLTCRHVYDTTLAYGLSATVVNTLAAL